MTRLGGDIWNQRYLYLLLLPGMLYMLVFRYMPMAGLQLAFKTYNARLGIWGSVWNDFANFIRLFKTPDFWTAFRNTLIISFGRLIVEFPFPIILAILLNEFRFNRLKRFYQTVFTFPYFLSWVLIGSILTTFLSSTGPLNQIITALGGDTVNLLSSKTAFRWLLFLTDVWKTAGWSCIIYMAASAGINEELYESAAIDGADRLQRIWHVTLPGLKPTIIVMFILQVGQMMNSGFDQVFNMYNATVYSVADILDTYVYRISFETVTDYGFSTAVGLFKSVINLILILVVNHFSKYFTEDGRGALFG